MTQREFSRRTGIAQSSISDWKRKKTNPVSEKILIICKVLEVSPYELLGATDSNGARNNPSEMLLVEKDSELGRAFCEFLSLDRKRQGRVLGYMKAVKEAPEA